MAQIRDVAAYILDKRGPMSAFKLQKLCYYSQAWSLVWDDQPLFGARIEAWANGPVVRDLYRMHHGMYEIQAGQLGGDTAALTGAERETVDIVLDSYGDFTGQQLSDLTHREAPWRKARERGGLGPLDRGNAEISHEDMYLFYEQIRTAQAEAAEIRSEYWEFGLDEA